MLQERLLPETKLKTGEVIGIIEGTTLRSLKSACTTPDTVCRHTVRVEVIAEGSYPVGRAVNVGLGVVGHPGSKVLELPSVFAPVTNRKEAAAHSAPQVFRATRLPL